MNDQLKEYVKTLFAAAPKSRAALELREEVTANCIEKYNDLVNQGIDPEDAYQNVIAGIGNVSDLFQDLDEELAFGTREPTDKLRKKTAMLTAVSVGMYIIAVLVFLGMASVSNHSELGLLTGIAIAIIPTCLLVYQAIAYPSYKKREETVVENFKEWDHGSKQSKVARRALSSVIWTICLILYFLISFTTGAWYITWILFLVASCIEGIMVLVFNLKNTADDSQKEGIR